MTNSQIFTAAHKLTKKTIKVGDSYSATFGLCLVFIHAELKAPRQTTVFLEIPFKNREARKNAKNFGFVWNSTETMWEKKMIENDIPYYLKKYVAQKEQLSYSEQVLAHTYFEN